jgi:hypothetical protein
MTDSNLPVHKPDDIDVSQAFAERLRVAALVESAMKFRILAGAALDEMIREMFVTLAGSNGIKFKTPNGRNCMLVLAVGDDDVGKLTDLLNAMTLPDGE